jgi:hypothetical protein
VSEKENKGGVDVLKTLLRLTASQGTSWIDAQQDATPKDKNYINWPVCLNVTSCGGIWT